jgi:hypothetical protein
MIANIPATEHTYTRVTRDDDRMRMECNCGKRSRWTELARPVQDAQDRHADEVAGSWAARHRAGYTFGHDSRYST